MTDNTKRLNTLYWLSFSLGLVWTTYLCLNSPGAYLDDEIGHFLLPLAPAFAIAAILGTEFVASLAKRILTNLASPTVSRPFQNPLIVSAVISVVHVGLQTKPRPLSAEGVAMRQAADWLRASNLVGNRVVSTHVSLGSRYSLEISTSIRATVSWHNCSLGPKILRPMGLVL